MKKTVKKPSSPVEGNSSIINQGGKQAVRVTLSAEEKAVGRTLVAKGLYKNINEYAADLKKYGAK